MVNIINSRSPSEYGIDIRTENGNAIQVNIGNGSSWIVTNVIAPAPNINNGAWHQIVLTAGATGGAIYLDGVLIASPAWGSSSPLIYDATHNLQIAAPSLASTYFPGDISEVAVFPTALTAAQVAALYNASK